VLASFYRPAITSKVGALNVSPSVLSTARDSVGGAVQVGATLPAATGNALIAIAKTEFVHAFASALLVGGGIIAIAAVVVFVFLPARARDAREHVADATDGLASLAFAEAEGALEDATAFGSVTARTTSEFG
jgi:DHA2 family multidrug resistance protein-like MFS transporter